MQRGVLFDWTTRFSFAYKCEEGSFADEKRLRRKCENVFHTRYGRAS